MSLADLFTTIKPPEVRDDQVSVRHTLMETAQKFKAKRYYYVGRTEEQKVRRKMRRLEKARAAQERAG